MVMRCPALCNCSTRAARINYNGTLEALGDVVSAGNLTLAGGVALRSNITHANSASRTYTLPDSTGTIGVKVTVPSTASSTCVAGNWAADASYYYACTATNTWVRAALATW